MSKQIRQNVNKITNPCQVHLTQLKKEWSKYNLLLDRAEVQRLKANRLIHFLYTTQNYDAPKIAKLLQISRQRVWQIINEVHQEIKGGDVA